MYTLIAILASVFIIFKIIRAFINRNWKLIYTTFGNEQYFKIIGKLNTAGIKYKSVTPYSFDNRNNQFIDQTQYDIYVKKEVEHLAVQAIHNHS